MTWNKSKKTSSIRACMLALALSLTPTIGLTQSASGREILDGTEVMNRVDARPRGTDQLLSATWRLISKSGRERVRQTRSYWLDLRGRDNTLRSKHLIVFETPTQLEDTSFLVWSDGRVGTDDMRWVYLPALRKIRRIAGRDRGKAFAGTDFNYEDLSDLHVEEEEHTLLDGDQTKEQSYLVLSSVPRDSASPYSKRIRWVHPDQYTTHRVEFYDKHERLLKTLAIDWQLVNRMWVWKRLEMSNHKSGHRTVVEIVSAENDLGLDDGLFSQIRLRSGPPIVRSPPNESVWPASSSAAGDPDGESHAGAATR